MTEKYIEVYTKDELEKAVSNKSPRIIIKGDLAEKVNRAGIIKKLSVPAIAALGFAVAAIPFTGGASGVVAPATVITGMDIAIITTIVFLGFSLIITITNGYDKKFTAKVNGVCEASMELTKKNS